MVSSPRRVALSAAILVLALVACRWAAGGFDWSRFVVASARFVDAEQTPVALQLFPADGYDGQFFCRLAFDPLTRERTRHGITLDAPAWRQQRILYPTLAYLVAFGRPTWIPLSLVLVNVLALVGLGYAFAKLARAASLATVWGLLPVMFSSFILPLGRDLAEPVAGCLIALSLVAALSGSHLLVAALLTGAVLTREQAMLSVMALVAATVWLRLQTERTGARAWVAAVPVVVLICWHSWLRSVWGTWPSAAGTSAFDWPLSGFLRSALHATRSPDRLLPNLLSGLHLLWGAWLGYEVVASWKVRIADAPQRLCLSWVRAGWLSWSGVALFISEEHWHTSWNFVRVLGEWSLLGYAAILLAGRIPGRRFVAYTVLVFAVTFVRLIVKT